MWVCLTVWTDVIYGDDDTSLIQNANLFGFSGRTWLSTECANCSFLVYEQKFYKSLVDLIFGLENTEAFW